jgi:hypothetical protein
VQFRVGTIVIDTSCSRLLLGGSALAIYEAPVDGGDGTEAMNLSAYMATFDYITNGGMVIDASQSLLYVQVGLSYVFPVTGASKLLMIDLTSDTVISVVNVAQTLGGMWLQSVSNMPQMQLYGYYLQYGAQPITDPTGFSVGFIDPKTGIFTPNMSPQYLPVSIQGITTLGSVVSAIPSMLPGDYELIATGMFGYQMAQNSAGAFYVAFNATGGLTRPVRIIRMPVVEYMQVIVA